MTTTSGAVKVTVLVEFRGWIFASDRSVCHYILLVYDRNCLFISNSFSDVVAAHENSVIYIAFGKGNADGLFVCVGIFVRRGDGCWVKLVFYAVQLEKVIIVDEVFCIFYVNITIELSFFLTGVSGIGQPG